MMHKTIRFIDMFAGIGGFREGLRLAGGFECAGFCECDKYAQQSYPQMNTRRGRVGHKIAHTLTTDATQGTLIEAPRFVDLNEDPDTTEIARCLTAKQNGGIRKHKREASGILVGGRIRRLTPRECLRLQGWADDRIDKILAIQSDSQVYKQAGNGVTVTVVEAIGKRLAAVDAEVMPH